MERCVYGSVVNRYEIGDRDSIAQSNSHDSLGSHRVAYESRFLQSEMLYEALNIFRQNSVVVFRIVR